MSRESLADAADRARPVTLAGQHVLPVVAPLAPLFPDGGLRRGTTVAVGAAAGATSLALSLVAAASQAGSWCAALDWPSLGLVAAAGLGVALERFGLVADPGREWAAVAAALIDAVDLVLLGPSRGVRVADARRLMARARERGVVLVVSGATPVGDLSRSWLLSPPRSAQVPPYRAWPGVDLTLSVEAGEWRGLGHGHGHLQACAVEVSSIGRGAASRERRVRLWLPGSGGTVEGREVLAEPGSLDVPAAASGAAY